MKSGIEKESNSGINTDDNVFKLQMLLNRMKIGDPEGKALIEDGIMGRKTIDCITKFQYIVKQNPTGEMDESTWKVIEEIFDKCTLKIGTDKYLETRYVQWRLNIYVDGIFGNATRMEVMRLQKKNALTINGIVGKETWDVLLGG